MYIDALNLKNKGHLCREQTNYLNQFMLNHINQNIYIYANNNPLIISDAAGLAPTAGFYCSAACGMVAVGLCHSLTGPFAIACDLVMIHYCSAICDELTNPGNQYTKPTTGYYCSTVCGMAGFAMCHTFTGPMALACDMVMVGYCASLCDEVCEPGSQF